MPFLVAAVEAICDPDYKFNHLASLGSPWPLLIVNGPLSKELGFNSGTYVLGHSGHSANSTVAKAISLLLWNCALARDELLKREISLALVMTEGLDNVSQERITREVQATFTSLQC